MPTTSSAWLFCLRLVAAFGSVALAVPRSGHGGLGGLLLKQSDRRGLVRGLRFDDVGRTRPGTSATQNPAAVAARTRCSDQRSHRCVHQPFDTRSTYVQRETYDALALARIPCRTGGTGGSPDCRQPRSTLRTRPPIPQLTRRGTLSRNLQRRAVHRRCDAQRDQQRAITGHPQTATSVMTPSARIARAVGVRSGARRRVVALPAARAEARLRRR